MGSQGNPLPNQGGWKLNQGDSMSLNLPTTLSAARFWARTGCTYDSSNHLKCETGDCPLPSNYYSPSNDGTQCQGIGGIPPYTIIELTLGGGTGDDFYDLSLVDGYNLPVTVQVQGTQTKSLPPDSKYNCGYPQCKAFDYSKCPPELVLRGASGIVACLSICSAINNEQQRNQYVWLQNIWTGTDPNTGYPMKNLVCCACGISDGGCEDPASEFCCSPYNNDPNEKGGKCYVENWPLASDGQRYDQVFKNQCPDAYSWQFDDSQSTYQCVNANYKITFC